MMNGANGASQWAKDIAHLGAVGVLCLLVLGGAYYFITDIRAKVDLISVVQAAILDHRRAGEHTAWRTCVAVSILAKLDPRDCSEKGAGPQ